MKYRLLIIDDEHFSRTTLANCFSWEQVGFELVGQAANGQAALDFLNNNTVHVLLCDINMPILNGIDLIKIINTWENPPITVFFSGYRDFEYARQAIAYGVRFYLLKPVKYDDLLSTFTTIKMELDKKYLDASSSECDPDQDRFITKVHAYVNQNIRNANLKDLSNQLYMNSSYVSQLYKQKTGRNFSDYLLEVRMKKAAELLTSSSEKIYSITAMVGYNIPKNFSRAFIAYYGKSPTEYRELYRNTNISKEHISDE